LRRYHSHTHAQGTSTPSNSRIQIHKLPGVPCGASSHPLTRTTRLPRLPTSQEGQARHACIIQHPHTRPQPTDDSLRLIAQAYTRRTRLRRALAMDKFLLHPRPPFHVAPHTNARNMAAPLASQDMPSSRKAVPFITLAESEDGLSRGTISRTLEPIEADRCFTFLSTKNVAQLRARLRDYGQLQKGDKGTLFYGHL
jgi:hypothetical protein